MGAIYLAALIIGLGVLGLQFFLGGDGHGDAGHALGDGDHGDAHASGDKALATAGGGHADFGVVAIFLSLRFWTFGALGFGLVGSIAHFAAIASPLLTAIAAIVMGVGSGALASSVFNALSKTQVSSGAEARDAIGQVGRVLVPIKGGARGKIRIELRGQTVDLLATADDAELGAGDQIVIEEMRGTTAHVARASEPFVPKEK
jgi:membrane protein implicated in regulation of membrane protease activity